MRKNNRTKPRLVRDRTKRSSPPAIDPISVEPNVLRDKLCQALSIVAEEERSRLRDSLIAGLKRARVNIGQCLLLLGIPARTVDELTAPEIATLIRYVRINDLSAMTMLVTPLSELLTLLALREKGGSISRKAA